ncbi:MAG: TRAP transporter small permease [bacterium]|nr:TRAP transporter small permease [bacterium]
MDNNLTIYPDKTNSALARIIICLDKFQTKFECAFLYVSYIGMVLVVCGGVVMRYVLVTPNQYGEELSKFLMITAVYIGVSLGVRFNKHLGLDWFVTHLPPKTSKVVCIINSIVTTLTYLAMTYFCFEYVLTAIERPQYSPAMRLPMIIMYSVVMVGFLLATIRAAMVFWNDYLTKDHPLNSAVEFDGNVEV